MDPAAGEAEAFDVRMNVRFWHALIRAFLHSIATLIATISRLLKNNLLEK